MMETTEHSDNLKVFEALEKVKDRESFVTFVWALVDEREQAEALERENPEYYKWGAPLGWQNSSIAGYLSAALNCVEDSESLGRHISEEPSWRAFAEFLYMGKIYE
jgi:hypothetical protein